MTDLLDERALDLALAEVQGWPAHHWEWQTAPHPLMGKAAGCLWRNTDGKYERHDCYPMERDIADVFLPKWHTSLDLIAAAEEPLVKAGWWQRTTVDEGEASVEWWIYESAGDGGHRPVAYATAPTEKIARGNAAYRALKMLKEGQG